MRSATLWGLIGLTAAPAVGLAQDGERPAAADEIAAPAAGEDPRAQDPDAPDPGAGPRGMIVRVEGVSDQTDVLSLGGAQALEAGAGALGIVGGRLFMGQEGARIQRVRGTISGEAGARLLTTPGSAVVVAGGDLLLRDGSQLRVEDSSLSVSGGSVVFQDEARLSVRAGGELQVGQDAQVVFGGEATLRVQGGSFELSDGSRLTSAGSSLTINDGSLELSDSVDLQLDQGALSISGGSFQASDASQVRLSDSQLDVRGGNLSFGGESALRILGGDIAFSGSSAVAFSDRSSLTITHGEVSLRRSQLGGSGSVRFAGETRVTLTNSTLTVGEGGALRIDEAASVQGIRSTLAVGDGALSFADLGALDGACGGDVVISVSRGVTRAVCLRPTPNGGPDDTCQSRVDPETDQWVCEDVCVSDKGGQLCGKTSHF